MSTSTILESQNVLKRQFTLFALLVTIAATTLLTLVHYRQIDAYWIDQIAPPLVAVIDLFLFIYLYKKPESLRRVMLWTALTPVGVIVLSTWVFTLEAFGNLQISLISVLPPFVSVVLVLPMLMAITLRRDQLLVVMIAIWLAIVSPILIYLVLHPIEVASPRGLDLAISLGPSMAIQIALTLFYVRLQQRSERLYAERLSYYSKVLERQHIRQQAIEQAFTQIHNGPLQTLTVLLREVQRQPISAPELFQRLDELNSEIRAVGQSLLDETLTLKSSTLTKISPSEPADAEAILRLGEGTCVDLNLPLHRLFQAVYTATVQRHLPHFATLKIKVREFAPLEDEIIFSLEIKRNLCLWLEEALCNVGKHAQGATRITVTGQRRDNDYVLQVQDNGRELTLDQNHQGTQQSYRLATQLGGRFRRELLPQGGVVCELTWPLNSTLMV